MKTLSAFLFVFLFISATGFADTPVKWPDSYQAEITVTIKSMGQKNVTIQHVLGDKIRFAPAGHDEDAFIVRPDLGIRYELVLGSEYYREEKLTPPMQNRLEVDGVWTLIGDDTIAGESAEKYEVREGSKAPVTYWLSKRTHSPLKMATQNGDWVTEWKIVEGPQDPSLFELPAKCKKMP